MRRSFHIFLSLIAAWIFGLVATAEAKEATARMKEFNKECPAPKICGKVAELVEHCGREKSNDACSGLVTNFRRLLPEYDCQRPFDVTATKKYIVPALWLCESRESFLNFLSKMTAKDAQKVFSSKELREALEGAGYLAEEYVPKLFEAERALK